MGAVPFLTTALFGLATYRLFVEGVISGDVALILLSSGLLTFTAIEVLRTRNAHPERWLVNPAVLGAILFALSYGATNALFLLPFDSRSGLGGEYEIGPDTVKTVALALLASLAMWAGYWSPLAMHAQASHLAVRLRSRLLQSSSEIRTSAVPAMLAVSVSCRLLQVRLGVFGYSSTADDATQAAHLSQYVFMGAELGKLALAVVALQCYRSPSDTTRRASLWAILLLEVTLGVLSGFKSAVVLPFVIVTLCIYLAKGTIGRMWIAAAVLALAGAYGIVEPFRAARDLDGTYIGTTATTIVATVAESAMSTPVRDTGHPPLLLTVAHRLNLTYPGSYGVQYADEGRLTHQDPEFLTNLLLSPIQAWVPRFLWAGKATGADGLWYYQVVMGRPYFTSAAMGPVTYLYCAGGFVAIVMGFFTLGLIQRLVFFWLAPWSSLAGAIMFVGLLPTVIVGERSPDVAFTYLFRNFPLLLVLQFLLFSGRHGPSDVAGHPAQVRGT